MPITNDIFVEHWINNKDRKIALEREKKRKECEEKNAEAAQKTKPKYNTKTMEGATSKTSAKSTRKQTENMVIA